MDALHYLIKPISTEKLTQVLTKAAEKISVEPPSVVISCEGETVKLYESDIRYVESFLHYIVIHTKDKEYKIKENMSVFENKVSEVLEIKPCKRNNRQNSAHTKNAAKEGNAEERPDAGCGIKR